MQDSLKSFLIEIECPSGAKLTGVLSRVIHAMVLELSHPGHRVPQGVERPEDLYTYLTASPGHALNYIFEMPWEVLMRTMNQGGASGGDGDHWKTMQEQLLATGIAETWTNPFLARVYPKPAEEPREIPAAPETVQTILHGILKTLQGINPASTPGEDQKIAEDARRRLVLLIDNLDANAQSVSAMAFPFAHLKTTLEKALDHVHHINVGPQPSDDAMHKAMAKTGLAAALATLTFVPSDPGKDLDDGWGHTHEATTVQDLLREGDAMLKGTDKHEQMFKGMDDQQRLETACREIERLRADLTTLAKRVSGDAQRLGAVEVRQESMDQNTAGLQKDIQKLYKRVKMAGFIAAYGGHLRPEEGLLFTSSKGARYVVDNMSIRDTDGFCDSIAVIASFPDGRQERWSFFNEKAVQMQNLREKAQSIHQIIMLAKQIQKDPLLRKLFNP